MLEVGSDISQQNEGEFFLGGRKLGFEIGKDVEIGRDGVPIVHIVLVATVPAKGFSLGDLKARKINFAFFPDCLVVGGKIITDNSDQACGGVKACREPCIGGGSSQKIGTILLGGFNSVDSDRADDKNAHGRSASFSWDEVPSRERMLRAVAAGSAACRR